MGLGCDTPDHLSLYVTGCWQPARCVGGEGEGEREEGERGGWCGRRSRGLSWGSGDVTHLAKFAGVLLASLDSWLAHHYMSWHSVPQHAGVLWFNGLPMGMSCVG